jgi:uncharacterized protein with HEPN domain
MNEDGRGDILRLADILRALRQIELYTAAGREEFIASQLAQDAVVRNLEIIGEAAGKVSLHVRTENPKVEWARLRGFASFAKHEYWRIDPERLWTVVEAIPELARLISSVRAARLRR